MGSDVVEEVQRLVLNVVELVASDGEEGVEEETGGLSRTYYFMQVDGRRRGLEVEVTVI